MYYTYVVIASTNTAVTFDLSTTSGNPLHKTQSQVGSIAGNVQAYIRAGAKPQFQLKSVPLTFPLVDVEIDGDVLADYVTVNNILLFPFFFFELNVVSGIVA